MPQTSWREARAIATHPRIEQAAREAGFGSVRGALPRLDAIVASIESLE
jgi:uroporphyrinogen-III synthase